MKQNWKLQTFTFLLLFSTLVSFGQLANFTLVVTKADETCAGNGSLTFNVSNTAAGSIVVYTVYQLPNTTNAIATLSTNSLTGLVAGNYRVVATQTLASNSNSQQQDINIASNINSLTYTLSGQGAICLNDGIITVNVTQGTAISYEIIAGPIIAPLQSSNTFTGLAAGFYQVRVFNACGDGVVQSYTVMSLESGLSLTLLPAAAAACEIATVSSLLSAPPGQVIAYPLTIECTVIPPSGPNLFYTQIVNSGGVYQEMIPLYAQTYAYTLKITDSCGNVYNFNGGPIEISSNPGTSLSNQTCLTADIRIFNITGLILVSAPTAYPYPMPQDLTGTISLNETTLLSVPLGSYTFNYINLCGEPGILEITISAPTFAPQASIFTSCDAGYGSLYIYGNFNEVFLIAAPEGYPNPLPDDVTDNTSAEGAFVMGNLIEGTYIFQTVNFCGELATVQATVTGYTESTSVTVIPNCGSFDLNLIHTANNAGFQSTFWLQKYNSLFNVWEHPGTGVLFSAGQEPNAYNSILLNNNVINYNLAYTGSFRILKKYGTYSNGSIYPQSCISIIKEFEFSGVPEIINIYSFACDNNSFDAVVEAVGSDPLMYRITQRDGQPFLIENNLAPIFTGLTPATYSFQIQDNCGNIINRIFDIGNPVALSIQPQDLCEGQPGSLTLPALSFLQYSWWKGDDVANILSTTNALSFAAFSTSNDIGIYHVGLTYSQPTSCINQVLDFTISATLSDPDAGLDAVNSFCGSQGIFNLYTMLSGTPDNFGQWEEPTSGGTLNGALWDSATAEPGTYHFKYRVEGFCNTFDESEVTIVLLQQPETPTASFEQVPCENGPLQLQASTLPNANYVWTGPDGYTSTEQNPIVDPALSGTYTVQAFAGVCQSGISSIDIVVPEAPQFTVESGCAENFFTILVVPNADSFNPEDVEYAWSGPANFSSSINPVNITGLPAGDYVITVTNADGCSKTETVPILNTLCGIPKGLSPNGDGENDTFDLAGFDNLKLKIFNRYGMVVYEMAGYVNQWHGEDTKGRELPSATYYYLIQFETGESKSGWVYLQRN